MRRFLIALGVIFAVLAVLLVLGFPRLVDEVLRPWAVTRAATALDAEVSLDRLELGWGRMALTGLQVARPGTFRAQVAEVVVDYSLAGLWQRQLDALAIRQPELEWQGSGTAGAEPAPWPQQLPLRVAEWRVTDGRLQLTVGKELLLLRQVAAAGTIDTRFTVDLSALLGNEPGVALALSGAGRWEGHPELTINQLLWSGRPLLQAPVTIAPGAAALEVSLSLARLDDSEAAELLAALGHRPPWPPELAWSVTGPRLTVGLAGERLVLQLDTAGGEMRREGERWPWQSVHLQLLAMAGSWEIDGTVGLPAQARLQLTGRWSAARFSGRWRFAAPAPAQLCAAFGVPLPPRAESVQALTIAGDLQAAVGTATVDEARLAARLPESTLSATLAGRWQDGALSLAATDLVVARGDNRLATAALKVAQPRGASGWQGEWQLRVADARQLSRALAVAVPAAGPTLLELDLQGTLAMTGGRLSLPQARVAGRLLGDGLSGTVVARLSVHQLAAGWGVEVAQLAATQLEYLSADGLAGVTGGALQLSGTLALQDDLEVALRGTATAGEALAGSWYADLAGLPLHLALEGAWTPATGAVRLHAGRFDLAGLASARLQGKLAGEQLDVAGEVAVPQLGGAFLQRLRQLATGLLPDLAPLELAGGVTATVAGGWRADGWQLAATVRPAAVTLAWGDALHVAGLSGELPLLLQRGPLRPESERLATVRWDDLRGGPLTSSGGALRLRAGPNRWQLEEPLRLAAGGGWLELRTLALGLPASGPEARASLTATAIEMAELSRAVGATEMGGQLTAELPDIRFAGEEISTGGEALLQVFDGTVRVRNMRVNKPFSPYPTYHADIDFKGIDLQLLTRAFAFGEINGVADGAVLDLRLFGAVPSAFRATIETREEGTRNISVKALRNLNTLSQGGLSAALSQGIYRFIDFYRYRKIGIRCSLKNDLLHLAGTARPGTTTYLIDGGWLPPRIDVIVSSPNISFQEIVKRLKRLERTGH